MRSSGFLLFLPETPERAEAIARRTQSNRAGNQENPGAGVVLGGSQQLQRGIPAIADLSMTREMHFQPLWCFDGFTSSLTLRCDGLIAPEGKCCS